MFGSSFGRFDVDVDDATDSDGLSGPLPWSWSRDPSADFLDPDLGI